MSHEKPVPNLITEQCQKTHIARHHFDDTCGILDTAFDAPVGFTGAAWHTMLQWWKSWSNAPSVSANLTQDTHSTDTPG